MGDERPDEPTVNLQPCPCGRTPTRLSVEADHDRPKWAYVSGNCCGEWSIEYRNAYTMLNTPEADKIAMQAWNRAPRGVR